MDEFNLSIDNVSYKVKNLTIFQDITAKATAPQGLTLKGESGLGKTSLIKLMAGLALPTTGHIRYNDVEINKLDAKKRAHFRRQFMGIAFQNPHIIPSLNVRQNIGLALQIHADDNWASRNQVEEIMERFEISHRANAYFDTLSGGEARRVALARAFVTKPKIVLLDEPLTGLDKELAARVTNTIAEIKKETNALIVVATHNMQIAGINRSMLDFDTLPRPKNEALTRKEKAQAAKIEKQKAKEEAARKAAKEKAAAQEKAKKAQEEKAKKAAEQKAKAKAAKEEAARKAAEERAAAQEKAKKAQEEKAAAQEKAKKAEAEKAKKAAEEKAKAQAAKEEAARKAQAEKAAQAKKKEAARAAPKLSDKPSPSAKSDASAPKKKSLFSFGRKEKTAQTSVQTTEFPSAKDAPRGTPKSVAKTASAKAEELTKSTAKSAGKTATKTAAKTATKAKTAGKTATKTAEKTKPAPKSTAKKAEPKPATKTAAKKGKSS